MQHIKLKDLLTENRNQQWMREALEKDLEFLQEKLIEEGLWDTIKQKVGGVLDKTGDKAKELLLKPLLTRIFDKLAKDDPEGMAQLQKYATENPKNIEKLLNKPEIKQQQSKVEKELQSVTESLTEQEADDFIQEYIDAVLEEARVLKDDPRNIKRRERYAQRKATRAAEKTKEDNPEEESAADMYKKGKWKPSKPAKDKGIGGLPGAVDKLAIKSIEKGGDFIAGAADLAKKGLDTDVGKAAKNAVGGLIKKVYSWAKSHPKLTASVVLGLVGALAAAASISTGGIATLIATTIGATAAGAAKGGIVGYGVGSLKNMYKQIKGGKDSLAKMDYGDVHKSGVKSAKTGMKIGAAVGAGMHIGGEALSAISNMFGGGTAATAVATELATKATKDATKIVEMLMKEGWNSNLADYPIGENLNLYEVLEAGNPRESIMDIARIAELMAEQKGPEEAAKYLSGKITTGLSKMDPEVLKSLVSDSAAAAVQDTAQQAAQDTAQQAAQQTVQEISTGKASGIFKALVDGERISDINVNGYSLLDIIKADSPQDYKYAWQAMKMQIQMAVEDPRMMETTIDGLKGMINNGLSNLAAAK